MGKGAIIVAVSLLALLATGLARAPEATTDRLVVRIKIPLTTATGTEHVLTCMQLPQTEDGQIVRSIRFTPEPVLTFEEGGRRYAQWDTTTRPAIYVDIDATYRRADYASSARRPRPTTLPAEKLARYLASETLVVPRQKRVLDGAKRVVGPTTRDRVATAYDIVGKTLKFELNNTQASSPDAIAAGKGDCSEFTMVFTSLCRAAGIPTRPRQGFLFRPGDNFGIYHSWAEVYDEQYGGWVIVDPTGASCGNRPDQVYDQYLAFTDLTEDPLTYGPSFIGYYFFGTVGQGSVEAERIFPAPTTMPSPAARPTTGASKDR